MTDFVRLRTFDLNGLERSEIEAQITAVSWRLNNIGILRFTMPMVDSKCTEKNLAISNFVLAEIEGFPDWGGVIDFPRTRMTGSVGITALSGEVLFDQRVTRKNRRFNAIRPGVIYTTLIQDANDVWPIKIATGTVFSGGTSRSTVYHHHDLLARVKDLARLTGNDFDVTPIVGDGAISFLGNWYDRRGLDRRSTIELVEGHNVGQVIIAEQGPVHNSIYTIGEGSTWGTERLIGTASDALSISNYGYREDAEQQAGVKYQETLDFNADAILNNRKDPRLKITARDVENIDPALFSDYDVGDIVTLKAFLEHLSWAFDGPVRITSREYSGVTKRCRLEVEEWRF